MASAYAQQARRRAKDDQIYMDELKLKEDYKITAYANWEVKTADVIDKRRINARAKELADEDKKVLSLQNSLLKNLYKEEMLKWKQMLLDREETIEERKERIKDRAYKLKNQREDERRKFVNQMYDKQWRDACDDARTLDSLAITEKLVKDRKDAVNYKEGDGKKLEEEEARRQAAVWKEQMRLLDEKERNDQKARHDRNTAMRNTLDEQCSLLNSKKQTLKDRNLKNEFSELARWKEEEEAERKKQLDLLERAYARGKATREFNEANMGRDKITKDITRKQDLVLLQYAMEKERREIHGEWMKKQGEKEMAQKYRAFLEEQMVKEAEDTKDVDEYRRLESEKIWIKRDNDKKAQDDARSRLMHEVDIGRKEQMRLKREKDEDDRRYYEEQIALDKIEWDRQEQAEREKQAKVKAGVDHNMTTLRNQIDFKNKQVIRDEQEKFLLNKQMAYMEKQHQLRLKDQAGIVRDYHPRKHTNWYT